MNEDPEKVARLRVIAKNFAQNAFINKGNNELSMYPQSSSDDDEAYGTGDGKRKRKNAIGYGQKDQKNDRVGESIMMEDPNKLDLINHINSMKLLAISEAFDRWDISHVWLLL